MLLNMILRGSDNSVLNSSTRRLGNSPFLPALLFLQINPVNWYDNLFFPNHLQYKQDGTWAFGISAFRRTFWLEAQVQGGHNYIKNSESRSLSFSKIFSSSLIFGFREVIYGRFGVPRDFLWFGLGLQKTLNLRLLVLRHIFSRFWGVILSHCALLFG